MTWAVNRGSIANSSGLLVGCLCSERNNTTFINHVSPFIVYDSKPHPRGTSRNQRSALSLPSPLATHQRLVMDGSTARRPPVPLGLAPHNVCPRWLHPNGSQQRVASHFVLLGCWEETVAIVVVVGRGPTQSWKLSLTYMTTRCHVQTGEPVPQITHLGLTVWGKVMHHVYGLTYTGVGFSCPCYTLINTHARTHTRAGAQEGAVVKRPDGCAPAAEVVCAVWPLTDVGAAFRKHCSLTECQPSIKQITKPSSSPQPSHVCLPTPNSTPKRVQTHNGSWTSVQKLGHLHQSC